ncbi:MAG TPA: Calx-beta domain-containing protein [Verrucomicrobiae bacterium]
MKLSSSIIAVTGAASLVLGSSIRAEEQHAVMTSLSQTTISGYVDTSAIWSPGSPNGVLAAPAETVLFQDSFDTDSSANWNVFAGSSSGTEDYTIDWAFDYSTNRIVAAGTNTIPPAPNSPGSSRGVKMTVNHNDTTPETAAVNIYPKAQSFSGDYAVRFDMWINYNGSAGGGLGSTEHAIFGINHTGDKVNWHAASSGDGVFFGVAGEAGSGLGTGATPTDYTSYDGDPGGPPLRAEDQLGGFLDRDGDGTFEDESPTDTELNLLFPTPPFETTGAPGKQWVQVEIRQVGTTITWLMNGYVIAERTSALGYTSGNIMLGLMDVFSSIANPPNDTENFIIFDNVRVVELDGVAARPRLTLAGTGASAAEPNANGAFTITRTGDTAAPLSVNLRVRGTATVGQDFAAIPLVTNIPAGAATLEIPVTVINDPRAEPIETVNLDLVSGTGYEVFAPMTGTVEIADDNDVTGVSVAVANTFAYEGIPSDTAAFRLSRVGDTSGDITVNFALSGTAQSGVDYQNPGSSVQIPAGSDSALVTITPIDNAAVAADKTVILTIASGTGYVLGATTNGTVTIRNDDEDVELGPVLFSDNFDTDTSANWTVNEANPGLNLATFNWDYSTFGIPPAPHTNDLTTRGLRLQANIGDTGTFTGLSVSPTDFGMSTNEDYRLSFDMWINFPGPLTLGGGGSTMSLSAGVGTTGTRAQFPGTSVEGVLFSVTGDGGSGSDWRAYAAIGAPLTPASGAYAGGTGSTILNNTDPYYAPFGGVAATPEQLALYPGQTQLTSIGAPGMAWHEVVIEKRGTNFTWFVDNYRIATISLTNKEISTNIFVGYFDINLGQSENHELSFGLIDNLRVNALSTAQPPATINITGITRSGQNIQIEFTTTGTTTGLQVLGSETVTGQYNPESAATFQTVGTVGGTTTVRATVPITTAHRFFQIRQP